MEKNCAGIKWNGTNTRMKDLKIQVDRINIPKKRRKSSEDDVRKKFKFGDEEFTVNWSIDYPKKYGFECQICRKVFKDATALTYHEIHHPEVTSASVLHPNQHPLTSTVDHPLTCLTINSDAKPGRRRIRVKSFPDERIPLLVDDLKSCSLPSSPLINLSTQPSDVFGDFSRNHPTKRRRKSLETDPPAQALNGLLEKSAAPQKSAPNVLKIVKVGGKRWKVNCSLKETLPDLSCDQSQQKLGATKPVSGVSLEPEVLHYVKSKRKARSLGAGSGTKEKRQLEDELKVIAAEPKYFDEDDFDVVVEGQTTAEHQSVAKVDRKTAVLPADKSNDSTKILACEKRLDAKTLSKKSDLSVSHNDKISDKTKQLKLMSVCIKAENICRTRQHITNGDTDHAKSSVKQRLDSVANHTDRLDSADMSSSAGDAKRNGRKSRLNTKSESSMETEVINSRDTSVSSDASSDRRFSERRFKGEKPYICNHCPLTFSSLDNKVVHERTHKEKPFECPFCEMRFSFELSMKRHVKIHR